MEPPLLFRFGPKARSTSLGIALCTMFIVASFAVADGLDTSTDNLASNFSSELSLVTKKGDSGPAAFAVSELPSGESYAFGIFTEALVSETFARVIVFAVDDSGLVLKETYTVPEGVVLAGEGSSYPETVTLSSQSVATVSVPGRYSSTVFPSSWLLGGMPLLRQISGLSEGFNFAIASSLSSVTESSLIEEGFVVQPLIGIVEFLESGIDEIRSDAMWVLLPSGFVIAVLAYSFMGSETADRRHDIGIVKTVGAGRWRILRLLIANALVTGAWGGLLGLALGVVLSYGVSTLASSMFTSVFIVKASAELLAYAYIVTVSAAVAGALLPAIRMTVSKPVDDLKEAMSSD